MSSSEDLTVVCNVRTTLYLDPIDSKIQTLKTCESNEDIDGLVMRTWPDKINLTEESPYQETIDVYSRYAAWADRQGVTIDPPFDRRTTTSLATDHEWEVLVTPILCLAIYRGGRLMGVFPHTDDDVTHSAADAIGSLRTGQLPPPIESVDALEPDRTDPAASDHTAMCPDCDGETVNVQGVLVCQECHWSNEAKPRLLGRIS